MGPIRFAGLGFMVAGVTLALAAMPATAQTLKVSVDSFKNGGTIPGDYAFCVTAAQGHMGAGPDKSPRISWSKGPAGTKSYAIILTDTSSPTIRDNMNKEGTVVAADMPRRTFYHWVLVDIPPGVRSLRKGAESNARVSHGKPVAAKIGVHGVNDFGIKVFPANEQMKGDYYGYDGPCPPWNDEQPHHYHFTVYALSVPSLNLSGAFDGATALTAMEGKVLVQGAVAADYTLNPSLGAKVPK